MMRYDIYTETNIGKARSVNEDNFCCNGIINEKLYKSFFVQTSTKEQVSAFAVFDGMGGMECGGKAAYIAAKLMKEYISISKVAGSIFPAIHYLDEANEKICQWMKTHNASSGSTAVIVNIFDEEAKITNLGDSRAYLLRDSKLHQLSEDHTQSALFRKIQKEAGAVSIMEPDNLKNILTQYLGVFADEFKLEPSQKILKIKNRDIILLCSDGLTSMLSDERICSILVEDVQLGQKGQKLINEALKAGGEDNITVILIEATRTGEDTKC